MAIRDMKTSPKGKESGADLIRLITRIISLKFSPDEPEPAIVQILKDIRRTFKAQACWLFSIRGNQIELVDTDRSGDIRGKVEVKSSTGLSPQLLKRSYPIICNTLDDIQKKSRPLGQFLYGRKLNKLMGVPLIQNGQFVGALNVAKERTSAGFTEQDLELLEGLGGVIVLIMNKGTEAGADKPHYLLEAIVDNIPSPVFVKDENLRWVLLNKACSDLTGLPRESILGKSDYDLFPKKQADFFRKKDRETFRTGRVIDIPEESFIDKRGNQYFLHTRKAPLKDSSGRITHLVGTTEDITGQKQAEGALREAKELYQSLMKQALEGLIIAQGKPTRIVLANKAMADITEYSVKELTSFSPRQLERLLHPEERYVFFQRFKDKLEGKKAPKHYEFRVIKKDGSEIWVAISSDRINFRGKPAVLALFTDVTERKLAEEATREAKERYLSMFEDSPVSMWEEDFSEIKKYIDRLRISGVTDFRAFFEKHPQAVVKCAKLVRVIDVNRASLELYQAKSKKELTSGIVKLLARESYEPFREELISIGEGQTVFEREAIIRDLKGKKHDVVLRWMAATGHEKTLSKVLVTINDISQRKKAEEDLRTQKERYQTLVETALEGIGISDANENLLFVNQAFAKLLGYRKDELVGRNLKDLGDKSQYELFKRETAKRKSGATSRYEATLLSKSGKPIPVYVSAAPLLDENRKFVGTLGVLSDLTDLKKIQEFYVLLNTSRSLARSLNPDQVLQVGAEKMLQALRAERCAVMFTEDSTPELSISLKVFSLPRAKNVKIPVLQLKTTKDLLYSYRRSLQVHAGIQASTSPSDLAPKLAKSILCKAKMASALIIPLFQKNKLLAVFYIGMAKEPKIFTPEQVRLALTMGNQVGAAMQNCMLMDHLKKDHARIFEQTKKLKAQYREQKMMFELTQTLTSALNLDELLQSASQKVVELLETELCSIVLADPDGQSITIRAVYPRSEETDRKAVGYTFTANVFPQLRQFLKGPKPLVLSDISKLPKDDPVSHYFLSRGIKSTVAVGLISRGKFLGLLTISTKEKIHPFTEDEIRLLQTISNPIAVTIENYQLLEDLKQKYGQIKEQTSLLKKQTREQEILLKVSQALSEAANADQVIESGTEIVRSVLKADRCEILISSQLEQELEITGFSVETRVDIKGVKGRRFSLKDTPAWAKAIQKGKSVVIRDASDIPPDSKFSKYFRETGMKSALGIGLFFGKKPLGVLGVSTTHQHRIFSPEEIELVKSIADQIAVALENVWLMEEVKTHHRELRDLSAQLMDAEEQARKNIAQELHDHEGQMLLAVKMNLDKIKRDLTSDPEKLQTVKSLLSDTQELLNQTIDEIRTLTFELRPPMLEDFGLMPALKWILGSFEGWSGVKVSLKSKGMERRYSRDIEVALFRIAQEALTNISKHARAKEVTILVTNQDTGVNMSIRDNGVGFDAERLLPTSGSGMGLLNIKERVDMLGGKVEIISQPRKGTTININIPSSEVRDEEDKIAGR